MSKEKRSGNDKCEHFWDFMDKWKDSNTTWYEFYCKNCLAIEVVSSGGS